MIFQRHAMHRRAAESLRKYEVALACAALVASPCVGRASAPTLNIYYIDTEGGQSTLFVTPARQTVLVDTGFPGTRDAQRIVEALHDSGSERIDFLIITHYHGDHVGGFLELAKQVPILRFIDHGPSVENTPPSASKIAYDEAAARSTSHTLAQVGYRLPLATASGTEVRWTIVASAGRVLQKDVVGAPGGGTANPYCGSFAPKDIQAGPENAQSVGSLIEFGKFRTIDLGDLLWNQEAQLMCPRNHLGRIDLLLTPHHGMSWSGSAVLVAALEPRVAIMNNGISKGGEVEAFEALEAAPRLENLWQLHWSANALIEHNVAGKFIANLEDAKLTADLIANPPAPVVSALGPVVAPDPNSQPKPKPPPLNNPEHAPAYWIKVAAQADGTFTVTNARNGFSKTYRALDPAGGGSHASAR